MTADSKTADSKTDCPFCMIARGDINAEVVYQDDHLVAFMDLNPVADGHLLVIPRAHAPNLYSIPAEDLTAVVLTVQRLAGAVNAAVEPAGINLFQANGPGAGQSVYHFHMHVLPRGHDDGLPMSWEHVRGDPKRIAAVAAEIRRRL